MTKIPDWYNAVLKPSKKDKPPKEYMVSLTNAAGTRLISMKTLCEKVGLDYDEEVKRMKKEGLLNGEGCIITAKTLIQYYASQEEVAKWDEAQNKVLVVDQDSKKVSEQVKKKRVSRTEEPSDGKKTTVSMDRWDFIS